MTPLEYCANKAAHKGSSLHYALYFASREQQPALRVLHAYRAEVTEIVRECRDVGVARMKLRWWQEELARGFDGKAQHPVTQALQDAVLPRYPLAREYFEQMLEGVGMDLEYGLYPSFRQLSLYCHRVGGSLAHLAMEVCGYEDRHTLRAAHDLGMGFQLLTLLRRVRTDAQQGRVYLPEDEMSRHGVTAADLGLPQTSEKLRALFVEQADRIEKFLDQGLAQIAEIDRARQRALIILAELYRALLAEIRADGFPLLERREHLTPLRKLWIAWRTARRLGPPTTPRS